MTLRSALARYCEIQMAPGDPDSAVGTQLALPGEYLRVLSVANGFVTRGARFRFFGIRSGETLIDLQRWNRAAWKTEYGALAEGLLFIAEDVFGDQYGYRLMSDAPRLVKFWCEGGQTEDLSIHGGLESWLLSQVLTLAPKAFDTALADEADDEGLTPGLDEHLAFVLPLIAGGSRTTDNLEVAQRDFHLNVLGQISVQVQGFPEGTRIARFEEGGD